MGVLALTPRNDNWITAPLGRVAPRCQQTGRPDLEPLSVFLVDGVVPRSSRSDNHNRLGSDLGSYLVVHSGDLVVNKLRAWQGGLGVADQVGIVSPAYFVCRPDPSALVPRFLHYLMRSTPYLQELTRISKWMPPSQFDVGWDDLRNLRIAHPDLEEQRRIADFLDAETARIDALIAKKRRMIDLLEERRKQEIRAALRGPWPELPLKRKWRVTDCKHRTPDYLDEGYPVVSPGDATPGLLDLSRCHRFVGQADFEDLADVSRRPKRGDIIYSRNASIGIASYVDTDVPFCMGQDVCLITSRDQDQRFLTYALNTLGIDQLDVAKIGSTFSRVNVSQIVELVVPCPSSGEQAAIADQLDRSGERHRSLTQRLKRQSALLLEHRQALITAAVTGELAVAA